MNFKKKELNSLKDKRICTLKIYQLIIFIILGLVNMFIAFCYLVTVSTANIFTSVKNELTENKESKTKTYIFPKIKYDK